MLVKSFLKLFAGTVAVQVITLLFYPLLGRIYTPADFGVLGFYTSSSLVLSIFCSGQFHMAFPQINQGTGEAKRLGELAIVFSFCCCLLVSFFLVAGVADFFGLDPDYWWLVPLFAFSLCLNEISKMWLIHLRNYGGSSLFVSSNRLFSNITKIAFPKQLGLIYSEVLVNLILAIGVLSKMRIIRFRDFLSDIKKYRHYPTYYSFGALSQTFQQELPILVFRGLFPMSQIGYYVMANRFTVQSVLLITSSVVLLLANQGEHELNEQQLKKELKRSVIVGVPIVLLGTVFIYFFGDQLFRVFLGPGWEEVGIMSLYLIGLTIPKILFTPLYARILRFGVVRFFSFIRVIQILGAAGVFYVLRDASFYNLLAVYVLYDFVTDIFIVIFSYYYLKNYVGKKKV